MESPFPAAAIRAAGWHVLVPQTAAYTPVRLPGAGQVTRTIADFQRTGKFCEQLLTQADALDDFAERWDGKYPKISESWRNNWASLSTYFKFPEELRRLIYTTNNIEGFNRQLRKVTKAKAVFPTDDSLFKMLYLAMKDITKKWTGKRQDWKVIRSQLNIYYGDRIPE